MALLCWAAAACSLEAAYSSAVIAGLVSVSVEQCASPLAEAKGLAG
jgi:hypothetical protein